MRLLTDELRQIGQAAKSRQDVDFADAPKEISTDAGREIHGQLEHIVLSAHDKYQERRIRLRRGRRKARQRSEDTESTKRQTPIQRRNISSKATKIIHVPRKRKCPRHPTRLLQSSAQVSEHLLIDLAFTRTGCRKIIVKYEGRRGHCTLCDFGYLPPKIKRLQGRIFGDCLQAWAVYQKIDLRLSYRQISSSIRDLFQEEVPPSTVNGFTNRFAKEYARTERLLVQKLLNSGVIHVDETKLNIVGTDQYVWVITDGKHTIFRLTPTREGAFIRQFLKHYNGVLVSDFYGGYDAVSCQQQKCLVHLIRDLNDDLWKNPFNKEYELFVSRVRDLRVPIFDDEQKYGLKRRHLHKHTKSVNRFYKQVIDGQLAACEITARYQKRFAKYRESLFRFLEADGIPWHNNLAERMLRHIAIQRKLAGDFTSAGAERYLRLLGIMQSCRLQGKSFLHFLLSEQTDVDGYKDRRR